MNKKLPELLANMQIFTADLAEHTDTHGVLEEIPFQKVVKTQKQDCLVKASMCSWKEYI